MAWEDRNGRSYYYRKQRIGDRVRSVYVGTGIVAAIAADIEAATLAEKARQRDEFRHLRETQDEIDRRVDVACQYVEEVTASALKAAGFHQHRGQWRRRHEQKI